MRWLAAGAALAPVAAASARAQQAPARLALVRTNRLLLRDENGAERPLFETSEDRFLAAPAWSPDGEQIAFTHSTSLGVGPDADWGDDIAMVPSVGGPTQPVYTHDRVGAQILGLAWAADGQALVFGYAVVQIVSGRFAGRIERIERLTVATGERSVLVNGGLYPSASHDGRRIAYLTQDDSGGAALWVAEADGSDTRQVVDLTSRFFYILYPRLSPDGSSIAFAGVAARADGDGPFPPAPSPRRGGWESLARARVTGAQSGDRVHGTNSASEPLVLPLPASGRGPGGEVRSRAADASLAALHGFPMELFRVAVADGAITRLTDFGEDEPYPAWSADGETIMAIATGGLYQMKADGGNLRRIGPGEFGGQLDAR